MKKILTLVLFLLYQVSFAQNLVPNPSFEDITSCPTSAFEINKAEHWYSCRETSDYFNVCCNQFGGAVGVPSNVVGFQVPHSGDAYAGLIPYSIYPSWTDELIGVPLVSPTIVGQKYFCTFYVSFADITLFAVNKLGIKLTTTPYSYSNPYLTFNSPTAYSDSIYSDTLGWSKIELSFIADSSYQYLMLGNFFDNAFVDTIGSNRTFSYYYFDDICLSTDSLYCSAFMSSTQTIEKSTLSLIKNYLINGNYITLEFNDAFAEKKITLYNLLGQIIYERKTHQKSIEFILPQKNSIYIIHCTSKNLTETKKIIIN